MEHVSCHSSSKVEQRTFNPLVGGSIPSGRTNAWVTQLVEYWFSKPDVAGSIPVSRSKLFGCRLIGKDAGF